MSDEAPIIFSRLYRVPMFHHMPPTVPEIAARIHLAMEQPERITDDDLSILSEALLLCLRANYKKIALEYSNLSAGGDLQQDVAVALANLGFRGINPTLEPLMTTFERDEQFYEAMHALLAMTFPKTHGTPTSLKALDATQRQVLKLLASADSIWRGDMTLGDLLTERGLPVTKHEINKIVALVPTEPTNR